MRESLNQELFKKTADGLQVPFETLAELAAIPFIKLRKVPIISWASAGKCEEVIEEGIPEEWIEVDVDKPNLFALRVQGESMEPEFTEGEIIIVDTDSPSESGHFIIPKNGKGEITFKQAKKHGNVRILRPLDPKYSEIEMTEEQRYIGKVIRKIKKY